MYPYQSKTEQSTGTALPTVVVGSLTIYVSKNIFKVCIFLCELKDIQVQKQKKKAMTLI